MLMYILVLLCSLAARALADSFQPILTQISAGSSECNNLLGDFDLKTVPQFNALCNIPTPDYQQSEFLLEYNVVPILCMGLMDVSLRLCTSAKSDISPFEDIFPPTAIKFNKIFDGLSKSNDFSLLDEFCSKTVKKFSIKEAASNDTQLWWQILNKELGDEKHCSNICHSNEENKVHPLCSYILWSNGVFINYQKNRIDEEVAMSAGVLQTPSAVENAKEPAEQGMNSNQFVKNESPTKSTEAVLGSDPTSPTEEKTHKAEVNKSFTTNNNNVGEGTVEQVVNNIGQSAVADTVKTASNSSTDVGKMAKAPDAVKSKKKIVKETATPSTAGNLKAGIDNNIREKPVPSAVQSEVKTATASSSLPGVQSNSGVQSNPGVAAPVAPEPQKQAEGLDIGKAGEGLVEGDVSLEVTPDNTGMDQPIPADKEFQPQYTDEEGEDGDGDDVVIVESNNQANIGTVSNGSNSAASKAGSTASNHQGLPEGDKVYGEGEVLIEDHFIEAEDSHFFTYFLCMAVLTIMAYLAFHNKKKLIALAVEGRRTKGGRRRPNSSHYSKLDCSLEEALVSNTTASVTHVLY